MFRTIGGFSFPLWITLPPTSRLVQRPSVGRRETAQRPDEGFWKDRIILADPLTETVASRLLPVFDVAQRGLVDRTSNLRGRDCESSRHHSMKRERTYELGLARRVKPHPLLAKANVRRTLGTLIHAKKRDLSSWICGLIGKVPDAPKFIDLTDPWWSSLDGFGSLLHDVLNSRATASCGPA